MVRRTVAATCLVASLVGVRGVAAQALYVLEDRYPGPGVPAPHLLAMDPDAGQLLRQWPVAGSWGADEPYLTPDGGLAVWLGTAANGIDSRLSVMDLRTGAVTTFPDDVAWQIAGNPVRPEVYLHDASSAFALSAAGWRRFSGVRCAQLVDIRTSADGTRVLYHCASFEPSIVLDAGSGTVVFSRPLGQGGADLDRDGRTLFAVEAAVGSVLRRYDVASGAVLGQVPLTEASAVRVDPRSGRVVVAGAQSGQALDPVTLQRVGPAGVTPGTWTFDPDRARAYVLSRQIVEPGDVWTRLTVVDTDTWSFVQSYTLPVSVNYAGLVVAPMPATPVGLVADVAGSRVTLSWAAGGRAATVTRYLLEAGSAPGRADIVASLDAGVQTSLRADGVASGTYYVRVRAENAMGHSAPSNEVVVRVP